MAKKRNAEEARKIIAEAKRRFTRCEKWESTARARFIDDIKFCEGDSDNLYQWPEDIRGRMEAETRAMLTINKTKQHCFDIMNDARQSRVAIKIRPTGGGASFESAQVYMGVIRHIEYVSNAAVAYQTGLNFAVRGGIGYWRILTDYANEDSFDQEIFIRRVKDPLTIYLDPDINEYDGSDARFGFVFTAIDREEYDELHPEMKGRTTDTLGPHTWVGDNKVKVAEYFRRVQVKDRLIAYQDPDDPEGKAMKVARASDLPSQLVKLLDKLPTTQTRPITSHKVEWFKLTGDEITEEREWLGAYIPIIRCIGEETIIDGQLDRKGHTRALKDPQRMFNYNASGSVEFGALQSKTPFTGPADAIEGYEEVWNNANTQNPAFLPWNHRDDDGEPIPAPQRQTPPLGAPVYMEGMNAAAEWMRMVSGQYQADMGAPSNERSGVAIQARQRQGDNATYHFLDHESIAIRNTGKQLVDLIPKIYDTERVLKIVDPDGGEERQIRIDPNAKEALQTLDKTRDEVAAIFNPSVGKYEVEADVGPAFATARQEGFNAFSQLLGQNSELVAVIGDLWMKMADFPGAEEAALRLKRMVPAQALEDGPSPDVMAAQQQIEALQNLVKQLAEKLANKTADQRADQEKNAISAYDAQTKRLAALKDALNTNPERLVELVRQVIEEAELTSGLGLGPALQPDPLPGEQPAAPPQPPAPPQLGPGQMDPNMMAEPNASPDDMGAGPAPGPGMGPV